MFVKTLQLENIRSFEKAEVEFHPHINLIVGRNNSGKSTIIKSLYSLQTQNAIAVDDIRRTYERGKVNITLADINKADSELFAVKDKARIMPSTNLVDLTLILSKNFVDGTEEKRMVFADKGMLLDSDKTKVIMRDFYLFDDETKNNFIYPFFARRKVYGYSRQVGGRKTAFKVNETLSNLVTRIQHISNSSHPQSAKFESCVRDILGFDIGIIPYKNEENTPGIFVDDNLTIEIEKMGEGVVNILGMITLLLTQNRKLYLIEEPENDIHPEALKKLLNLILEKADSNQFIISTHSNIVVKYLGSPTNSKIFGLKWKPHDDFDQNLPTSTIQNVDNTPDAKLSLLSDLGYDLLDFDLFASYVLFEESSAERIVRDFLIPWFVPTLVNKVRTIAANGVSDLEIRVIDFARLFIFIHHLPIYTNKCWVFADGDEAGARCILELKQKFNKTWKPEQFQNFSKPNFEDYYPTRFTKKIAAIKQITNNDKKRELKRSLLQELIDWAKTDENAAKKAFRKSFAEIIGHLEEINARLCNF